MEVCVQARWSQHTRLAEQGCQALKVRVARGKEDADTQWEVAGETYLIKGW